MSPRSLALAAALAATGATLASNAAVAPAAAAPVTPVPPLTARCAFDQRRLVGTLVGAAWLGPQVGGVADAISVECEAIAMGRTIRAFGTLPGRAVAAVGSGAIDTATVTVCVRAWAVFASGATYSYTNNCAHEPLLPPPGGTEPQ